VETFIATGMVVHLVSARPAFTEISPETFSMDFEDAWARVTERTRGAIVVHFGGLISPAFPAFAARMQASGRFVIEDAAHAPGAELNGKRAGSLADAACFSFFPTKIMTTGEGGMLVTSRVDVALMARSLQNRGLDMTSEGELYQHPGRNNHFSEIAAAMGLSQLRCLPEFLERRRYIAALYDEAFRENDRIQPIRAFGGSRSSYWRYPVLLQPELDRKALRDALKADGITIDWPYDPPLHLQPVFRQLLKTRPGMLPRSEALLSRHVCLPMHARLRDVDAAYVIERVHHHVQRLSGAH
jgi:dTDP-4-amino-4,6-dideoxygalactose transaminase